MLLGIELQPQLGASAGARFIPFLFDKQTMEKEKCASFGITKIYMLGLPFYFHAYDVGR